jgi:hypothetical protein
MSYQTSIHFDPTALLIIKNEVDSSIDFVESAVSSLIEDQSLPFGIEDALNQFEQCAQVLALIDMQSVAKIAQYSAELMRKIMQTPHDIHSPDVVALSDGTSLLKRYIEFICLREVQIPQFLLATLNHLELALGYPLTQEGHEIESLLGCLQPNFTLPSAPDLEKSHYVQRLYKLALVALLGQQQQSLHLQALKIVGIYMASMSRNTPSHQYWQLLHIAFNHAEQLSFDAPRLRSLIQIERNISAFLAQPQQFSPQLPALANVLSLCISQESEITQHIREQIGASEDMLTDTQLKVFSRHLYGPSFDTIHTVSELIAQEINQLRHEIEHHYQNMSAEKAQELLNKFHELANIFVVLNLNEAAKELRLQAQSLHPSQLKDPNFAQQVMNCIQSAMNSIGILERQHTSGRLQLGVHNSHISLDRLDDAHSALLTETKALIEVSSQSFVQYLNENELTHLATIPAQLREIGGALLFLNAEAGQRALAIGADFVEARLANATSISTPEMDTLLEALASADMLVDNLKNKQPVLHAMFDVALQSTQKLKNAA